MKRNKNETKRSKSKRNETKRNRWKRNETKHKTKRIWNNKKEGKIQDLHVLLPFNPSVLVARGSTLSILRNPLTTRTDG